MTLKGPGAPRASSPTTAAVAPTAAPELLDWEPVKTLPSLLLIGGSGSGKTTGLAQLIDAGFKLGIIAVEDKLGVLNKLRPKRLDICTLSADGKPPTAKQKWDRLRATLDKLRRGDYHKDGGIDIIAIDGLMEVSDIIMAAMKAQFTTKDSLPMWNRVAELTLDFFRDCRDVSGEASARLGVPPIGIVATCGEATVRKINIQQGGTTVFPNLPQLAGEVAKTRLPFIFEVIWRLESGPVKGSNENHEFRVFTQCGAEFIAKSPSGLFEVIERGPGGRGNKPDIGAMYRELVENPESPYSPAVTE